MSRFNAGLEGNAWRAIDSHEGGKVDVAAVKDLIRAAIALNPGPAGFTAGPAARFKRRRSEARYSDSERAGDRMLWARSISSAELHSDHLFPNVQLKPVAVP